MTHETLNDNTAGSLGTKPSVSHENLPHPVRSESLARQPQPFTRRERSDGVTLLAFYHFAWAALFLLGASLLAIPATVLAFIGFASEATVLWVAATIGFAAFLVFGLSIVHFAVTVGLWTLREWARVVAIALGVISLPTIIGTIPGILTIWYLMKEEIAELFR